MTAASPPFEEALLDKKRPFRNPILGTPGQRPARPQVLDLQVQAPSRCRHRAAWRGPRALRLHLSTVRYPFFNRLWARQGNRATTATSLPVAVAGWKASLW